jgi:hypothetical protein
MLEGGEERDHGKVTCDIAKAQILPSEASPLVAGERPST